MKAQFLFSSSHTLIKTLYSISANRVLQMLDTGPNITLMSWADLQSLIEFFLPHFIGRGYVRTQIIFVVNIIWVKRVVFPIFHYQYKKPQYIYGRFWWNGSWDATSPRAIWKHVWSKGRYDVLSLLKSNHTVWYIAWISHYSFKTRSKDSLCRWLSH